MSNTCVKTIFLIAGLLFSLSAAAKTYSDNFSGKTNSLNWAGLDYACLTAGTSATDTGGIIKACSSPNDPPGSGALRLTPAQNYQTGAILSGFTFPSSQGLQVTFTTYTYGGDSGGTAHDGADGITFFLTDGTFDAPTTTGASGGALGYSCSNTNSKTQGLAHAYLGLGIDEFGNFLNSGDNTDTGILNTNSSSYSDTGHGSNTYANNVNGGKGGGTGPYYQPERIGLRGAGNTTWAELETLSPTRYYGSPNTGEIQSACRSGEYVDKYGNKKPLPYNYKAIPGGYKVLPDSQPIANEASGATRADATPITYKIKISSSGLLNFSYSYNNGAFTPVLTNSNIKDSNGPVPSSFRFGFSAGTGGSNNVHEITCFEASPLQSNSSASANTVQSGEYRTGTQIYLAAFSKDNWWGSLQAISLDESGGALVVRDTANWDAKCVLTGGACPAMGQDTSGNPIQVDAQAPDTRNLITWNDASGAGVAFKFGDLSQNEQDNLNSTNADGANRLDWLRGNRTDEQLQNPPGDLRARTYVLGDIINSSPTFVGAPSSGGYPDAFRDNLYPADAAPEDAGGATTYSAYVANNASRLNVVYVGSNDGFLHGFEAGTFSASGTYDATKNDGHEVLGFMPAGVLSSPDIVNLTDPDYAHAYFVDATPAAGDVFYNGGWHTWLVGGVGSDGNEIYALDVTDPGTFSQANAASLVKGDWNSSTPGLSHLAHTVGTPVFTRMHNGDWAFIFGSGLGGTDTAGVYIGLINPTDGSVTFKFLDTGKGSGDGIAYVTSVDLDGDHIADYLYAGDTQGNLWRFDVTSDNPLDWKASKFGHSSATPLYVARDAATGGNTQPITTAPTVATITTNGTKRVMVLFGTGQETPFTTAHGDEFASGTQTFYGIWDWDMGAWDTLASNNASAQFASLGAPQSDNRGDLFAQTVVSTAAGSGNGQVQGYRYLSTGDTVCWKESTDCKSGNDQYGWYFDLPGVSTAKTADKPAIMEQVIYNPVIIDGAVVVSTAIPAAVSALQCNPGTQTGWTMAFDPANGGGLDNGFFPGLDGSFGIASDGSTVSGVQLNAVGSPTTVNYNGQSYLVTQTVNNGAALSPVNPPNGANPKRVSWRELTN